MIGFDGAAPCATRLREALHLVLATFPEHLAKPRAPTAFEAHEMEWNEQFDAIVRAHKRDRLAMPMQALLRTGAWHHNFELMHARRLAWFVPSLLAAWLERQEGPGGQAFGAQEIDTIVRDTNVVDGEWWGWTEEEAAALARFFEAALEAALATPLPPPRPHGRPLEDGLDVWSHHGPSVPLDVLRVARSILVPIEPLVLAWVNDPSPLALEHLLEAVFDPITSAKRLLAEELVADRLGDAFFAETGDRALRLSKAEVHIRRWIARAVEE